MSRIDHRPHAGLKSALAALRKREALSQPKEVQEKVREDKFTRKVGVLRKHMQVSASVAMQILKDLSAIDRGRA